MLIQRKIGNINSYEPGDRSIEIISLEWYELNKRILHKVSDAGRAISIRFLQENQQLTEGDILFEDASTLILVSLLPCEAVVIIPKDMMEMAAICYEIGNKHLPLFYHNQELLIAFEKPVYHLLLSAGYDVKKDNRKLLNPLRTSVAAHSTGGETLFSKILRHTNSIK